jgi:hypothetical protein
MRLDRRILKTARFAAVLGLAVGFAGCDSLLEVSDPSRYTSEGLDDPLALAAVANGIEGSMQLSMDGIGIEVGLLSDELMHTGTWTGYEDSDKGRYRPGVGSSVAQSTMNGVLTAAVKAEERFKRVLGDAEAMKSKLMAQITAAAGWAPLLMGMINCESVVEPNGPALSDTATMKFAIPLLTRAIEVATGANQTLYVNMARAGRARAYLLTGDYDKALADAQAVPNGFAYSARYSTASSTNSFVLLNHYTENKAAGLDSRRWGQVDTTRAGGDVFLDKWSNQPDPRVQIVHRVGNRLGVDGRSKFYSQNKYKDRSDDVPMTHWKEMRLIEAEVYWRKGDFPNAIAKMNLVRTDVGLPNLTNPGTSAGVFDRLLEERFATLFLEGQRAGDIYRFNLFPTLIGTGYNTKFPMNTSEALNNPNAGGRVRQCPKVS